MLPQVGGIGIAPGGNIGDGLAVFEIERGDHVVVFRSQQHLLQEVVGDHILDDDLFAVDRILETQPWTGTDGLGAVFLFRQ